MKKDEIRRILEEIDVLLLLAASGERERRIFAWQMFVWGSYVFFNMTLWLLFPDLTRKVPGSLWFHTMFVAFYFSTVQFAGWFRSLIWVGAYLLSVLAFYLSTPIVAVATTIVSITVSSLLVYGALRGKAGGGRMPITGYVGMVWGILFASFWWNFVLHGDAFSDEVFNLWITYVFGTGILLSGVIFRRFFLLGLFILFGLPLLARFGDPYLFWGYDLSALTMAVMGITLYLKDDRRA